MKTIGTADLVSDGAGGLKGVLADVPLPDLEQGSHTVEAKFEGVDPNFTVPEATIALTIPQEKK